MESDQQTQAEIANKVLWQRLREGKKQALGKIFNRYFDSLYSYGYRIMPYEDRVRDAIQEVFFQLWKYRENLDEVQSVKAYLFVSFKRQLLNTKKNRQRREQLDGQYVTEQFQDFFNYEKWFEILNVSPKNKADLRWALKQLTPRQREVVYLKYFEGLSTQELSDVMEIRAQSVYNLLADAIKSLRTYLDS